MLQSRIIPCLLVHQGGLVKTVEFSSPKSVGDPLNTVRIFNEKEVDELIVMDIDATIQRREPDYQLIASLAGECRMPLCYGGGVKSPEQVEKIVSLGIEKVAISSGAIMNPQLIGEVARRVGSQSIVIVLDVKEVGFINKRYELFIHNGKKSTKLNPIEFAKLAQEYGAGEIVVNSIDLDGTMKGYNMELVDCIREAVTIPITILGGAGSYSDMASLVRRYRTIGVAAGGLFVFKGKYRAVLISYPSSSERNQLMISADTEESLHI